MSTVFLQNTSLITYSTSKVSKISYEDINDLTFDASFKGVYWLNTYGLNYTDEMRRVIQQNKFDDFLINLLHEDEHNNKVIELDGMIFIALKVLVTENHEWHDEQMVFILTPNMLWSIQESVGSHFQWIRDRLTQGKGQVQSKKVDYLIFLIIESLIDSYESTFNKMISTEADISDLTKINPTPEFTEQVESQKRRILNLKKMTLSLRNTIVKLQSINAVNMKSKYFLELKEQANNLIGDIDFELFELDSKINLIFSIQGHRLNEIMRILTVVSAVFIPLTFLAGLYGMNFQYIPELQWRYGYFILLGVMAVMAISIIIYFKRKKWL